MSRYDEVTAADRHAPAAQPRDVMEPAAIEIGLNAAIITFSKDQPQILTVRQPADDRKLEALPFGPFTPVVHRTLETGLRSWVREQTGLGLGYTEQLYTFGDRGRHAQVGDSGPHAVSIGYLALNRFDENACLKGGHWQGCYAFFPWEDWRNGKPEILARDIEPRLQQWIDRAPDTSTGHSPFSLADRVRMCFGTDGTRWDEEKVLDRYELLFEAGLIEEAARAGSDAACAWTDLPQIGRPMHLDHRRILATAMGRLRAKIKYRPVVFELMDNDFTLFELQKTVEAILGSHLHKQNFRRLVESGGLVEPTGDVRTHTGGRPAKLFRFRQEVMVERPAPGVRVHATLH
ncbi:MAG: NUDIX hydrolase [Hyphomicrobiaceae bacterium]